jgi:F-box and leucine-rich repeat protein GRR1
MSQRAAFCVYSGKGVANLRAYLTELFDSITEDTNNTDDTEYDDDYGDKFQEDTLDVDMDPPDDEDELPSRTYVPQAAMSSSHGLLAANTLTNSHQTSTLSGSPAGRIALSSSFVMADPPAEPISAPNSNSSVSNQMGFLSAPRRIRGFGQQLVVETSESPPPSDAASNRSAQSSNGGFFRTYQQATRSNGAHTPDLNFAELGHGRGYTAPINSGVLPVSHSRQAIDACSPFEPVSGPSTQVLGPSIISTGYQLDSTISGSGLSSQWPYLHREAQSPSLPPPPPMSIDLHESVQSALGKGLAESREVEGRGRSVKRSLRNTFAFATNTFLFGRNSNSHDGPSGRGGLAMDRKY